MTDSTRRVPPMRLATYAPPSQIVSIDAFDARMLWSTTYGPCETSTKRSRQLSWSTFRVTRVPWVCQSSQIPRVQSWMWLWAISTSIAAWSLMPPISWPKNSRLVAMAWMWLSWICEKTHPRRQTCLLYTSDAADDLTRVDL